MLTIVSIIGGIAWGGGFFLGVGCGKLAPTTSKQEKMIYLLIGILITIIAPILEHLILR